MIKFISICYSGDALEGFLEGIMWVLQEELGHDY
jgi:hypothetical protein